MKQNYATHDKVKQNAYFNVPDFSFQAVFKLQNSLFSTVAQKGHTCKLKMLLQIKNSTCKLKIVHAN